MSPKLFIALLLPLLAASGCGGPRARPNIVLITLDAVRADRLSAYGHQRQTSPSLDALAGRGVLFEEAYAQSDWTLASLSSLLTGLYPGQHGAVNPLWAIRKEVPTLAERLSASGYVTAALTVSYFHDARYGMGRGFKTYETPDPAKEDAAALTARAMRWLAKNTERPYFLWLHYFDPHAPYLERDPWYRKFHPAKYAGRFDFSGSMDPNTVIAPGVPLDDASMKHLLALYDSEIAATDSSIGQLLAAIDLQTTLVCVTADHGEEFKEHGAIGHGLNLHRELIRVPLILAGPGVPAGKRVARTVQLVDVAPTLFELAGVDAPGPMSGQSLTAHLNGAARDPRATAFGEQMESSDDLSVYSLVKWPHHLILQYGRQDGKPRGAMLYDVEKDPAEQSSIWNQQDPKHHELKAVLDRYIDAVGGPGAPKPLVAPADPERMRILRSLGYLRGP